MKRIVIALVLGLFLTAASLIVWPILRVRQLSDHYNYVKENDSSDSVLKHMGNPWKDEECGVYLGSKPVGCVTDFIYAHPYAPYIPEYWVIRFDSNRRVINKVHLISP
jgi:hypothetical protein